MKQKKLSPLPVQKELLNKKISLFTPQEFGRILHSPLKKTKYFLETYTKQGMFVRLKQGLYALEQRFPTAEEIANALYKPSYISFEYALAKYGIIPEMVYTVTSATTKPTRAIVAAGLGFDYFKIKRQAFTGYVLVKEETVRSSAVLIAEPEKAVADYLYFVSLGKRKPNDRMTIAGLDKKKIMRYGELYKRPSLTKLLQSTCGEFIKP